MKNMINEEKSENYYKKSFIELNPYWECIKLKIIIEGKKGPVFRNYILEKINRIINKVPISLDYEKQVKFNQIIKKITNKNELKQ